MRVDEFDFDLPETLIALRPARPRRSARMLVAPADGKDQIVPFETLPQYLRAGDLIVFNDTQVIPARITGARTREESTVQIEATLIRRLSPSRWLALARPGKRLREGDVVSFKGLTATLAHKGDKGAVELEFDKSGDALDAAVTAIGAPPLPPYIASRRKTDVEDNEDYQTMFAARPGAVAAPTASLHFEPVVMEALSRAGVSDTRLTLHVGAGTFLPVSSETTEDHKMHSEWGEISAGSADAINTARAAGGRIIAAGTTALRLLETATGPDGIVRPWTGDTDIFITPGYQFRAVDGLITNFHLPRSTLFMLVSAFMGTTRMKALYQAAIDAEMRFYSYGDTSLLWRVP